MRVERTSGAIAWFENGRVAEATEMARREGKPMYVDLWAPGCKGCETMEARTYTDLELTTLVSDCFVPIKYDTHRPDADLRRLIGGGLFLWTPTLLVLDSRGREVRRAVGYLEPTDLIAELDLGLGQIALSRRDPEAALRAFERVTRARPVSNAAPEALYWSGVAAFYVAGRRIEALEPYWRALGARFPDSPWSRRSDVLEPSPPTGGTLPLIGSSLRLLFERAAVPMREAARIRRPASGDGDATCSCCGSQSAD